MDDCLLDHKGRRVIKDMRLLGANDENTVLIDDCPRVVGLSDSNFIQVKPFDHSV